MSQIEFSQMWRPIAEIHEGFGPCVVVNLIEDAAVMEVHWCTEVDFDESQWTHFVPVPRLLTVYAERLIAEYKRSLVGEPKP